MAEPTSIPDEPLYGGYTRFELELEVYTSVNVSAEDFLTSALNHSLSNASAIPGI